MRRIWVLACCLFFGTIYAQEADTVRWHNIRRSLRYKPEGTDITITNGHRKFTRALYGSNTAFRAEAGDLPEFALYMPGMGGNLRFGIISGRQSKWLTKADHIKAIYRAGSMLYEIRDTLLGNTQIHITAIPFADADGLIIRISSTANATLMWAYGGASGKRFSRDGDMGPDPESSFYLKAENCKDNKYEIGRDSFLLRYGKEQRIHGRFFPGLQLLNAANAGSPLDFLNDSSSATPAIGGQFTLTTAPQYLSLSNGTFSLRPLAQEFTEAEARRTALASRVKISTPDPYINTVGPAISIAADAIWESPSYLHGAVGWRMRLNGWRGAYAADVLGWHDRARSHFRSYAKSQIRTPASGPVVADTALGLARQLERLGTSVFSSGYISRNPNGDLRPHHYDMNLVFIDQLLWHFRWTGDTAFVREMWELLTLHLAWEKRNFDPDDDGLYDAYAAIWASDALQYSGGAVTHSSAYNYRANRMTAELARLIGKDGSKYAHEAGKILAAMNKVLWLPKTGVFAEFKDWGGLKRLHEAPALWTYYHTIDSEVPDAAQAQQMTAYVKRSIPHIPVRAPGVPSGAYLLSTSNWMPYEWSLNNVVLAENLHTSLAFWKSGDHEEAFRLWKSALLESMFMGGSAGNFVQISGYDAARGEAYRDFADPVGMAARSLVQGLFGIEPDLLKHTIILRPGLPGEWKFAGIETPDFVFDYKLLNKVATYRIVSKLPGRNGLVLLIPAGFSDAVVTVNGRKANWTLVDSAADMPRIRISAHAAEEWNVRVEWKGKMSMARAAVSPAAADPAAAAPSTLYHARQVDLTHYFNDRVTNIFRNRYLSPRPATPTLQLPVQGIGEWTHPLLIASINDSGLIALGGKVEIFSGLQFRTPLDTSSNNIIFTSQWDNYPDSVWVPLNGQAEVAYLLMAGSTNPMQSRISNGLVRIMYEDGSADSLLLQNPGTWWPIEQDYYHDGYAFNLGAARPYRVHLKTGKVIPPSEADKFNGKMIDGGAATVFSVKLNVRKKLKGLQIQTLANDVVVGLLSVTLGYLSNDPAHNK